MARQGLERRLRRHRRPSGRGEGDRGELAGSRSSPRRAGPARARRRAAARGPRPGPRHARRGSARRGRTRRASHRRRPATDHRDSRWRSGAPARRCPSRRPPRARLGAARSPRHGSIHGERPPGPAPPPRGRRRPRRRRPPRAAGRTGAATGPGPRGDRCHRRQCRQGHRSPRAARYVLSGRSETSGPSPFFPAGESAVLLGPCCSFSHGPRYWLHLPRTGTRDSDQRQRYAYRASRRRSLWSFSTR